MAVSTLRYSKAEFSRLGDEICEREIVPRVEVADAGKFVAINIEIGAHELDVDEPATMNRLLAGLPNPAGVTEADWLPLQCGLRVGVKVNQNYYIINITIYINMP
jgi:hypothetical protein